MHVSSGLLLIAHSLSLLLPTSAAFASSNPTLDNPVHRMQKTGSLILLATALFIASVTASTNAQTRRRKPAPKLPVVPTASPSPAPNIEPTVADPGTKKNERPAASGDASKAEASKPAASSDVTYRYEFAQPNFDISKIVIAHDDTGRGTITFTKKMFEETETDPLQVSDAALTRINAAYAALNFLDSNASYQYEKDFSHLGVMTFSLKRSGKERTAIFSYTENKDARVLADEYRKLGNQFIWIFDIGVARQNQPLQSPKLLDSLDALIRRKEISDPQQMLPLLKDLSNDERVPLIARNHASRLVQQIEKTKKDN